MNELVTANDAIIRVGESMYTAALQDEECMRYGFTKPSKPHSDNVRKVQEYNAAQPPHCNLPGESTHKCGLSPGGREHDDHVRSREHPKAPRSVDLKDER